jgi:hypothetical protein
MITEPEPWECAMDPCYVLRCESAGTVETSTGDLIGVRKEVTICEEHKAAMAADQPWLWVADQGVPWEGYIAMGDDLDAVGITLTQYLGWEEWGGTHPNGAAALRLKFERLRSDGFREEIRLIVDAGLMRDFAKKSPWTRPAE